MGGEDVERRGSLLSSCSDKIRLRRTFAVLDCSTEGSVCQELTREESFVSLRSRSVSKDPRASLTLRRSLRRSS